MGEVLADIDERLQAFIKSQHVFFMATAPKAPDGQLNLSPKGLDSLRVLGPTTVVFVNHVGSGVETIAHLR